MAAQIKETCGTETKLTPGRRGEFTVKYDGEIIAQKGSDFPPFPQIIETILQKQRGE